MIHLRPHPDFINNGWSYQLRDYLVKNGILAEVVNNDKQINEIVCDYFCMSGFPSSALREARFSCNKILLICLESVAKDYFINARVVFGLSEGIEWIDKEGAYDPKIFKEINFHPDVKKSVGEIITDLI